jgi:hypothetical protein
MIVVFPYCHGRLAREYHIKSTPLGDSHRQKLHLENQRDQKHYDQRRQWAEYREQHGGIQIT